MITARVPLTVSEPFCVDLWIPKVYLWAKATEMSDGELLQSHPRDQWNLFDLKEDNSLFKNASSMLRYATVAAGIESSQGLWRFLDQ